jgi:hypothetical protein
VNSVPVSRIAGQCRFFHVHARGCNWIVTHSVRDCYWHVDSNEAGTHSRTLLDCKVVQKTASKVKPTTNNDGSEKKKASADLAAEIRLLVSCVFTTLVFIAGQVAITIGVASGQWVVWSIMYIFMWNALLSAISLTVTSTAVRERVRMLVMCQVCAGQCKRTQCVGGV